MSPSSNPKEISSNPNGLSGKLALITGASRGLGKAMALALSEAGVTIALVARRSEPLDDVKRQIEAAGGRAERFVADVSREEEVLKLETR